MPTEEQPFTISSFCHSGGCVGVAVGSERVAVRSTQDLDGPVLSFGAGEWMTFAAALRDG